MQDEFGDLFDDLLAPGHIRPGRMSCIKRDLTQRVATVLDADRASELYLAFMRHEMDAATFDEGLEDCVVERGMTREEIIREFPPVKGAKKKSNLTFNRKALIATILWQEWKWVGTLRPKGNVRHFWYTHLLYALTQLMKDTEQETIDSTFAKVLEEFISREGFRYADLNFVSNKNKLCVSVLKDSPYPNIILSCEKESYHAFLSRLAHVFHITYISLGGQGSYGVNEDLVNSLVANHVDISQKFLIFVISDFDPQGYDIQGGTQTHLASAGIRNISLERVYLKPEHITQGLVARYAVPYQWKKPTDDATKGALTMYSRWAMLTGALMLRGGEWVQLDRNSDGTYAVPSLAEGPNGYELCRMELDNFQPQILSDRLIDALGEVIDGAAYYYEVAKTLWRETITRTSVEAAKVVIRRAVRAKLQPIERRLRELRDRLNERWNELTTDDQSLIERIREHYDSEYESIQETIDDIQEQIDALIERQRRLSSQQWDIRKTSDDMIAFLRAVQRVVVPNIPAAQELLQPVDAQLRNYRETQEEAHTEPVSGQFTIEPANIQAVVGDCSAHAGDVFQRAKDGSDSFTAELDYQQQRRVTSAAENDLEAQQEALTVEVPDLPEETVEDIDQRVRDANALLAQAVRTGELSEEWQTLHTQLIDHYFNDDTAWDLWDDWEDGAWQG